MSEKTKENETQSTEEQVEKFALWGVKLFQTKENADKFLAIKNRMSQKELENGYYDIENENDDTTNETYTGIKYLSKEELDEVGLEFQGQGKTYNLFFEKEEATEDNQNPKSKLVKADLVKSWTDSVKLKMSDVKYTKKNKPFVVLHHAIKESVFESAPNKEEFIEGMNDIGLESDLVPYNDWINFSAFVWLFDNEVEKIKSFGAKKCQWTLKYEQINDGKKTIKRIFGPTFEKDLLLEGTVVSISEDKKEAIVEKITNWNKLKEEETLNLKHFANEVEYLDVDKDEDNMKLIFNINILNPTEVEVGDVVQIFLNDSNVKKMKQPRITISELDLNNPFPEESEAIEEKIVEEIPEIELDEDEIPFG